MTTSHTNYHKEIRVLLNMLILKHGRTFKSKVLSGSGVLSINREYDILGSIITFETADVQFLGEVLTIHVATSGSSGHRNMLHMDNFVVNVLRGGECIVLKDRRTPFGKDVEEWVIEILNYIIKHS